MEWRSACHHGIANFELNRLHHLEELRLAAKARPAMPISPSNTSFECPICHLLCKSKAGLKAHTRHKHSEAVAQAPELMSQPNSFKCNLCSVLCKSRAGLMAHIRHRHKT